LGAKLLQYNITQNLCHSYPQMKKSKSDTTPDCSHANLTEQYNIKTRKWR